MILCPDRPNTGAIVTRHLNEFSVGLRRRPASAGPLPPSSLGLRLSLYHQVWIQSPRRRAAAFTAPMAPNNLFSLLLLFLWSFGGTSWLATDHLINNDLKPSPSFKSSVASGWPSDKHAAPPTGVRRLTRRVSPRSRGERQRPGAGADPSRAPSAP